MAKSQQEKHDDMPNGPNWQTLAAVAAVAGSIGGVGTSSIIGHDAIRQQDLDAVESRMETLITREITRADGWVDEIARKQDQVREQLIPDVKDRVAKIESILDFYRTLMDLVVRLERLERKGEFSPQQGGR